MQTALLIGSAWFIVALLVGLFAGRFIAVGKGKRRRQTGDYLLYWPEDRHE
jgi:uncharacterized protein YneF (UPF0154 family)